MRYFYSISSLYPTLLLSPIICIHLLEMSTITQLVRYRTFDIEMFLFYYSLEVVLEMRVRHFRSEILHDCLFFVRKLVTKKTGIFSSWEKKQKATAKWRKVFFILKIIRKISISSYLYKKAWRWNFLQSKPQQICQKLARKIAKVDKICVVQFLKEFVSKLFATFAHLTKFLQNSLNLKFSESCWTTIQIFRYQSLIWKCFQFNFYWQTFLSNDKTDRRQIFSIKENIDNLTKKNPTFVSSSRTK